MKAVILAAGEGRRLRPFTSSEPKVMIPVANKPILQYVVEALVSNDIHDIIMVVGYHQEKIKSFFGDGDEFDARISYIEQPKQLGTAHALYQARNSVEENFIVLPGDNLVSTDTIDDLVNEGKTSSVLITTSDEPSKYGVVSMENGIVEDIAEKPEHSISHHISTGIYYLSRDVFSRIEQLMADNTYDLTSVLNSLKDIRELNGIHTESMWMDAVYPWDLLSLNSAALHELATANRGMVEKGVIIKGPVSIGEGSVIKGGAYIEGPAIIGEGCEIGPHTCILPSSSIGNDCTVGAHTIICNSIVMDGARIGYKSILESSIIGEGVSIGAGFVSHTDVVDIIIEGHLERVENIGCMVAEDTTMGGGVTCYPGVIIGDRCDIRTGSLLRDNVLPGSSVR